MLTLKQIFIVTIICIIVCITYTNISNRINKTINFDELSNWICLERHHIEYYRWYDQMYFYKELIRLFPNDKQLKRQLGYINNRVKSFEKDIEDPNNCVNSNYFWYYPQNIRKIDKTHGKSCP